MGVRHLPRLKVEYQLTRAAFLRVVGDYDINRQDDLRDDGRTELPIVIRDPATGAYEPATRLPAEAAAPRLPVLVPAACRAPSSSRATAAVSSITSSAARRLRRESDGFFLKISYLFRV